MNIRKFVMSATAALALAALPNAASASPEAWERADNEYQVQHEKPVDIIVQSDGGFNE